jgi:hypothetical protein
MKWLILYKSSAFHKFQGGLHFQIQRSVNGRVYVQPKSKVAVTNMDCTDPVGVQRTFDQGLMEAAELRGSL